MNSISHSSPIHPAPQSHAYCATPSTHAPPFRQGELAHSSTAVQAAQHSANRS